MTCTKPNLRTVAAQNSKDRKTYHIFALEVLSFGELFMCEIVAVMFQNRKEFSQSAALPVRALPVAACSVGMYSPPLILSSVFF